MIEKRERRDDAYTHGQTHTHRQMMEWTLLSAFSNVVIQKLIFASQHLQEISITKQNSYLQLTATIPKQRLLHFDPYSYDHTPQQISQINIILVAFSLSMFTSDCIRKQEAWTPCLADDKIKGEEHRQGWKKQPQASETLTKILFFSLSETYSSHLCNCLE